MHKLIWTLVIIWMLGLCVMIARLWHFQIRLLNNLAPGESIGGARGGFFDSSRYNPTGQKIHREMLKFYWKVLAWGLSMPVLIGIATSLFGPPLHR
ncbi:MAG TPA: hypothetical protein VF583_22340 [Bradyrhizobium sp.]